MIDANIKKESKYALMVDIIIDNYTHFVNHSAKEFVKGVKLKVSGHY